MSKKPKKKSGPAPDCVKIDVPWEDAVKAALAKGRPKTGWPEAPKRYKKKPA